MAFLFTNECIKYFKNDFYIQKNYLKGFGTEFAPW